MAKPTNYKFDNVVAPAPDKVEGTKFDRGKLRYDLLPPECLEALVEVLTFGAQKYEAHNWQKVEPLTERYIAALFRHIEAWRKGEGLDPDSGLHHLAHAMCNVMFLLWKEKQDENIDRDSLY